MSNTEEKKRKFTKKSVILYVATIVLSAALLLIGNRIVTRETQVNDTGEEEIFLQAEILEITNRSEDDFENVNIYFIAKVTSGERKGEEVRALQTLNPNFMLTDEEVEAGSRVILSYHDFTGEYFFANYVRINYVIILATLFLILAIFFAKGRGFNAIVALIFTILAVFYVFIPAILAGKNIYLATIVVCAYAILSTLLIVLGYNKKSLTAILGCFGGVLFAGFLMIFMNHVLNLTGFVDQEMQFLTMLETPIHLRAIIFAGVLIGAVGAIMDVALSISSSLWELRLVGGVTDFKEIVKSGVNIGKDILGTMLNTLVLAYIGSSLSMALLISAHATPLTQLFNTEMVIVELLRALIGSFGMLFAIPLTAVICASLYGRHKESID